MGAEAWVLKGEVVYITKTVTRTRFEGPQHATHWNARRPQAGHVMQAAGGRKVGLSAREAATAGRSERLPGWREVLLLLLLLVPGREHRNVAATIEGIAAARRLRCMRHSLCCAIQLNLFCSVLSH